MCGFGADQEGGRAFFVGHLRLPRVHKVQMLMRADVHGPRILFRAFGGADGLEDLDAVVFRADDAVGFVADVGRHPRDARGRRGDEAPAATTGVIVVSPSGLWIRGRRKLPFVVMVVTSGTPVLSTCVPLMVRPGSSPPSRCSAGSTSLVGATTLQFCGFVGSFQRLCDFGDPNPHFGVDVDRPFPDLAVTRAVDRDEFGFMRSARIGGGVDREGMRERAAAGAAGLSRDPSQLGPVDLELKLDDSATGVIGFPDHFVGFLFDPAFGHFEQGPACFETRFGRVFLEFEGDGFSRRPAEAVGRLDL